MTCWVEVVGWGLSGCPPRVICRPTNHFCYFAQVISCLPLIRRTPGKHMWKQQQRRMLKHAKTCQDTTCQTYTRKQKSNMSVDLLKQGQKLLQQRRMLKHAKTCQDTTCQTYTRKQKSNMSVDLLKQGQKFLRQQRRMLKSQMHCSASLEAFSAPNMPNHVRIPPVNISVG